MLNFDRRQRYPYFMNQRYSHPYHYPGRNVPGFQQSFYFPSRHILRRPHRGGLLSYFIRGNRKPPMEPVNPFQIGHIANQGTNLPNWLNPETISRFLGQTQQVLHTGQQIGAMIQQYGPIIRNLPTLWKIYKGFQTEETEEAKDSEKLDEKNDENLNHSPADVVSEEMRNVEDIDIDHKVAEQLTESVEKAPAKQHKNHKPRRRTYKEKQSVPKLFI